VPLPWRLLLGVLLAASLYRASRAPRWREIRAAGDGTWRLIGEDGETREAVTAGPGLCHPWLVILDLRLAAGRRLRVPLFPDTLSASEFKALRRRLALPASQ
jgi:hypothetical protein